VRYEKRVDIHKAFLLLPVLSSAETFSKGTPEECLGELQCLHVRLAIIWL